MQSSETTANAISRTPVYYSLNEQAARTSHAGMSFSEFRSDEPEYRKLVDEAYELADAAAKAKPNKADTAYRLAERFSRQYAAWLNKSYRIGSMSPSVLIAGPAGINPRKKDKQVAAYGRHSDAYKDVMRLLDKLRAIPYSPDVIKANDDDAEERLKEKIASLKERQELMKAENAKARKEGKPAPYPSFKLTNNRSRMKDAEKRLQAIVNQKEAGTSEREAKILGEDVTIVENAELMRLQLVFEDKPSEEVREVLKRNAFKWSRKNGAWQRQLTANAKFALRMLFRDGTLV